MARLERLKQLTPREQQRRQHKQAARAVPRSFDALFDDLHTNWDSLTTPEKQDTLRDMVLRLAADKR